MSGTSALVTPTANAAIVFNDLNDEDILDNTGVSSLGQISDLCAGDEFLKRNAGDTAWECSAVGAGGTIDDDITVNSSAVDTTANLLDGDIDWTLVDGGAGGPDDITGTVACTGCIDATDMGSNSVDSDELVDGGIDESHLNAVDTANDEEILTFEVTTGDFEWHTCAEITGSADLCDGSDDGGAPGTDSVGTDQLDDDANSPTAGDFVVVETGAASFDYVTPNAGTDVTADLEEETHASEHAVGGADTVFPTDPNADRFLMWDDAPTGEYIHKQLVETDISDLSHTADEVGTLTNGDLCTNNGTTVECTVNTEAELETALDALDVVTVTASDISSANIITLVSDESGSGVLTMGTSATHTTPLISGKIDGDAGSVNDDDCTGEQGFMWYDDTDSQWEVCNDNSGTPEAIPAAGGSDTNAPKLYFWPASATLPLQPIADLATGAEDGVAPISKDTDTNTEVLTVAFDDTGDEFRGLQFQIPSDVDTGSNVTITFKGYAETAAAQDVAIIFAHTCRADTEDWDANMTEEALTTTLTNTQDALDDIVKSDETPTNLGWAADDQCFAYIGRDGDHLTDDGLIDDFHLVSVSVEIPRA